MSPTTIRTAPLWPTGDSGTMGCVPTQAGAGSRGNATAAPRTVSAGSAADITETTDRDFATRPRDLPRAGEETPTVASEILEAATTERRDKPPTVCGRRKAGASST